jgi:hypothetical protein
MTLVAEPFRLAAAACAYPLGFIFVVLARSQLFTENTLEPIIPLLHDPNRSTLDRLLSLWAIVLGGNLIGAFVFAAMASWTPMVEPTLRPALHELSETATSGGFLLVAYRAIYAGLLADRVDGVAHRLDTRDRCPGHAGLVDDRTVGSAGVPPFRCRHLVGASDLLGLRGDVLPLVLALHRPSQGLGRQPHAGPLGDGEGAPATPRSSM